MSRVCFRLQVRPQRLQEYRERHTAVWPEMLAALRDAGWENYSLFLDEDGLVIGYLETTSFDAAVAAMAATDVDARWQSSMADFFAIDEAPPGTGRTFRTLDEVFNLDQQLDAFRDDRTQRPDNHSEDFRHAR